MYYFFENEDGQAVTVDGERYRTMLRDFLWPAIMNMDLDNVWFQQDGATCHTARETIHLLQTRFEGKLLSRNGDVNWPPRSCDLTPLDFFLWDYIKSKAYVNNPQTIQELKDEIRRIIREIPPEMCTDVIEHFCRRIACCDRSRGGHLLDIVFHV